MIRIPKRFYDDHRDRSLPAPPVIKRTSRHYWIDADHPDMGELVNDAEYYAHALGPDDAPGVVIAAKALLRVVPR